MGALITCLERWRGRTPDGSLLQIEAGKPQKGSLVASLSQAYGNGITGAPLLTSTPVSNVANIKGSAATAARPSRRHPTYSVKMKPAEKDESSFEEDEEESEEEIDAISSKDLHQKKIIEFRKLLTKVVKLKTAIFQETVKVTCSKDGTGIEWYKGRSVQTGGQKKAAGQFLVEKVSFVSV
ncbi:hypothetical protein IE077_002872 [Cardiosporidium cionae]|uniref:Uncharacterized protein n=1 Tax=Cardiosporidium cionae TaxID=476202 RepID=A0ABQ7J9P2_9APIC|nr:hypothetical protein IE077_002872 [Cardiosporidium cionae]|eukprot:KAF8820723.1 hypothetical protein IE077_002872 [Cardiosporidium cionae]